jgi:hypothetical protein
LLFNIFVRNLPLANQLITKQFADDVTDSVADTDPHVLAQKLVDGFNETKKFCDEHELKINAEKTQLIIFKAPNKQIPDNFELILSGCSIKPESTVKLLGFTLDSHLTLAAHIDQVIRKAHGLIGALARAAPFLPRPLLKQAYTALIRSHLEYGSAVIAPAAKTHLAKLDVVQRTAARIIFGLPRDAHAEPLLDALQLATLESRRKDRVCSIVDSIIQGDCHPAFKDWFKVQTDGTILADCAPRTRFGAKRFRCTGVVAYNSEVSIATANSHG